MNGHKITRIYVRDYLGIKELDLSVGSSGAVARGPNGSGKSSILKAIQAAIAAKGVSADHIRIGEDSSELLVEIDSNISARRRITQSGTSLTVTKNGFTAKAPQTFMTELCGSSALDPMDLLLLKPKERRQKVLQALPVTLTIDKLREWWPRCPDTFDVSGHGLEVLENLRGKVYDKRTAANKAAKEARAEATRLANAEAEALKNAPSGAVDVDGAEKLYDAAKAHAAALKARQQESEKAEARLTSSREKIEELRDGSNSIRVQLPEEVSQEGLTEQEYLLAGANQRVEKLEMDLGEAREELAEAQRKFDRMIEQNRMVKDLLRSADMKRQQADDLESAIALATVAAVSQEDLDAASTAEVTMFAALIKARTDAAALERVAKSKADTQAAGIAASTAEAEADRLDAFVKVLTDDAQRELLASCDGIPGLTLEGETIKLDGKSLDDLCGAEQVRFAVEVAKRANAKTKILVVDKLEALDPVAYEEFIRAATADGWQLLASRVDAGELVIEAIGQADCAEAAE